MKNPILNFTEEDVKDLLKIKENKETFKLIKRFDNDWVKHNNKNAHKSKRCEDCFMKSGVKNAKNIKYV